MSAVSPVVSDEDVLEVYRLVDEEFAGGWDINENQLRMDASIEYPPGHHHEVEVRNDLFGRIFFVSVTTDVKGAVLQKRVYEYVQLVTPLVRHDYMVDVGTTAIGNLVLLRRISFMVRATPGNLMQTAGAITYSIQELMEIAVHLRLLFEIVVQASETPIENVHLLGFGTVGNMH